MAMDSIAISALTHEFSNELIGAKVDKIHQPEKDQITLQLRGQSGNVKLLLSASSANPRTHFTRNTQTNPISAPMFCMLLRKHLAGGKIVDILQPDFERVLDFCIESYTELGDLTVKHLIIEIMGRHSNIIVTDANGRIFDSIKHINALTSSVRQVMPGMTYAPPPSQNKLNPMLITYDDISDAIMPVSDSIKADKLIMQTFAGISPIVSRELCYRAFGNTDADMQTLDKNAKNRLCDAVWTLIEDIKNRRYKPCILQDSTSGKMMDFCAVGIKQYQNAATVEYIDSMNNAADSFFALRDASERKKQRSADLTKLIGNNIDRCVKKIVVLAQTIEDAKGKEQHKIYADLLTANIYRIDEGAKSVTLENFYSDDMESVTIPMDVSLSAGDNAQRYYKKYTKAKTAEAEAAKQMALAEEELAYLESITQACNMAQTDADLAEIKAELRAVGYIKGAADKKNKQAKASKPLHFVSSDGFDIYCGKNNVQNDNLTLRFANSSDLWFHTKGFAGSHTVIKLGVDKNVPDSTILEAANIAAYHSSARESSQVPVDYTHIKNVKKPSGAKPGMVIYERYNTIYVTPDDGMIAGMEMA